MKLGEKQEKTVSPELSKTLDANRIGRLLTSEMELSTDVDVLGSIYKQLLIAEKMDIDEKISIHEQLKKERDNEKTRNDEIIRALTGRKRKKPKKEVVEQKKPEEKKPGVPKEEAPKAPKQPEKVSKAETKPPQKAPAKAPTKVPKPTPEKLPSAPIITGAIGTTALLLGKEALAANISKHESGGNYNAYNKGTSGNKIIGADKPIDFSKMSISEYLRRGNLPPGDSERIFAMGKYQIIPKTMEQLVKKLKIDPDTTVLDPSTQDSLFANGLIKNTRKKVEDYITGKSNDRDAAILQLAQEFASIGIPYDMKVGDKALRKGDSYYSGIGGNKAHNPPEAVAAALDADRMKNLSQSNFTLSDSTSNIGSQIEQSSKENAELKKSLSKTSSATTIINNQTNLPIINGATSSSDSSAPDDRSAFQKKASQ